MNLKFPFLRPGGFRLTLTFIVVASKLLATLPVLAQVSTPAVSFPPGYFGRICQNSAVKLSITGGAANNAGNMLSFPVRGPAATTGTYLDMGPNLITPATVGFTFEAWIMPTGSIDDWERIASFGNNAANNRLELLLSHASNGRRIGIEAAAPTGFSNFDGLSVQATPQLPGLAANNQPQLNTWIHIAYTVSADSSKLYINGNQAAARKNTVAAQTLGALGNTLNNCLAWTNYPGGGVSFKGNMDEVRVWSNARSQAQVRQFMNMSVPGYTPGLKAYYTFDQPETAGNVTVTDNSANGQNAVLHNYTTAGYLIPSTITPFSSTNLKYKWFPNTNLDVDSGTSVWASPAVTTTYYVYAKDVFGNLSDTASITVDVGTDPAPVISVLTGNLCSNQAVLTTNAAGPYLWSNGATTRTTTVTGSGLYTVTAGTCVSAPVTLALTPPPFPQPVIKSSGIDLCPGTAFRLSVSNPNAGAALTYNWSIPGNASLSTDTAITLSSDTSLTVSLTATAASGCSYVVNYPVTIQPLPGRPVITKVNDSLVASVPAAAYIWVYNNNTLPGITTRKIKSQGNGTYIVTAVSSYNCQSLPSAAFNLTPVAYKYAGLVNIYPNPGKGYFNVAIENFAANATTLQVISTTGAVVFSQSINEPTTTLNLANLTKGIYIFRIANAYGSLNRKVVIN